jgi:LemA protein
MLTSPAVIVLVLVVVVVLIVISMYNRLVRLRQSVREGWSNIDTELRRRYDLIPNLVETVKGYATHEKETLENVILARNAAAATSGQAPAVQAAQQDALSGALVKVFALSEAYPALKADANFRQLQGELSETEGRVASVRQEYNDRTRDYNTAIEVFPSSLIAANFGFRREEFFEISDHAAREPVRVQF